LKILQEKAKVQLTSSVQAGFGGRALTAIADAPLSETQYNFQNSMVVPEKNNSRIE